MNIKIEKIKETDSNIEFNKIEEIKLENNEKIINNIQKTTNKVGKNNLYQLYNLLTKEECEYLTKLSESVGFGELSEFTEETRNNKRCFITSNTLSKNLYERIISKFNKNEFNNLKPYGFDSDGNWKPYYIDNC